MLRRGVLARLRSSAAGVRGQRVLARGWGCVRACECVEAVTDGGLRVRGVSDLKENGSKARCTDEVW